jgi:hypothetical protein
VQTTALQSQIMMQVYSLTGSLVWQEALPGGTSQTTIANVIPGFYVVRITENEQLWSSNLFLGSGVK